MKKPTLISSLAVAAIAAASLALPATASASSFMDEATKRVKAEHLREAKALPVHYADRHYDGRRDDRRHRDYRRDDRRGHGHTRWEPPRYRHDHGHHYGQHKRDYRYDYRPVERHQHRHNDDLRVRILYDLVL